MKRKTRIWIVLVVSTLILANLSWAQWRRRGYEPRRTVPEWEVDAELPEDVFTFVRIEYDSYRGWGRGGGDWATDWPNAELNLAYRMQELTAMQTHPEGVRLRLTDERLSDYPFIYIVEPGRLHFREPEVGALRNYLFNGGFLMVDDFWGDDEWDNFYYEIKRVFPGREPRELSLDHPIFNLVFPLPEKPQIPNPRYMDIGYEVDKGNARTPHYKGIFDDNDRMMVVICHNTDLGDGWEEEAYHPEYFHRYSEKWAYPLGINIIFYAMTH